MLFMSEKIKKIGVLTSGGDAPGMNAAIRAVVRTAINHDIEVIGIKKGYDGLINGEFSELKTRDVSEIIGRGGTILHTARCEEMMTEEGRKKAATVYNVLGLDALIVIGGDGSMRGAKALSDLGVNVIGIPGTIDLDMNCTEYTIGFDTAVNTGAEAISRLRDTSSSHQRCSVIEVMGRHAPYIAYWCAMVSGAEEVLVPDKMDEMGKDEVIRQVLENRSLGKFHNLIIVAEGVGGSQQLAKDIEDVTGIETRATILGHLQRGGSPTAIDRMHASVMGNMAVEEAVKGNKNRVIVFNKGRYDSLDINEALDMPPKDDGKLYDVIKVLSR